MHTDAWFTILPYCAGGLAILAVAAYLLVRRTGELAPTEAAEKPRPLWNSPAWRLGIGGVLAGHLIGLLLPSQVLLWNQHPARLLALEATGLAFASLAIVGLVQGLWASRGTAASPGRMSTPDAVVLTVLATVLVSGIAVAVFYRWGSSWYAATLVPYLYSLLRLAPEAAGAVGMPMVVRLHVVGAFVLIGAVSLLSLGRILTRLRLKKRTPVLAAGSEG